ncbi:MAG: hypothetical protein KDB80_12865 [Planctomycetes bacterium]|nr:hypothetical protein [Planctomycetota bacterium]
MRSLVSIGCVCQAWLLAGCGFGSAGIVAGASGGSDGNSAPSLSLDV